MQEKKALMLLKKYYLPYYTEEKPSVSEIEASAHTGLIVPF